MMNLAEFKAIRAARAAPSPRPTCNRCRKAMATCYCHALQPFEAPVEFVILQHFAEFLNPIATGQMAHLAMTNSKLLVGREFAQDRRVDAMVNDLTRDSVLLYPSRDAVELDDFLANRGTDPRPISFWLLDVKWSQAAKMMRLSPNIQRLPKVRFSPDRVSQFQIRRQPNVHCLSTIESAFLVIDRYVRHQKIQTTDHQALLDVFQYLVKQQLEFVDVKGDFRHTPARLRRQARRARELSESTEP